MDSKVSNFVWSEIDNFSDYREFDRFLRWITNQVEMGLAVEVPVGSHYAGISTFKEKWFQQSGDEIKWRLVWPDAPFEGAFEQVATSTNTADS